MKSLSLFSGMLALVVFLSYSQSARAAGPQTVAEALGKAGVPEKDQGAFCAACEKCKAANASTEEGKKAKAEAEKQIAEILQRNGVKDSGKAMQAAGMSSEQAAAASSSIENKTKSETTLAAIPTLAPVSGPKEVDFNTLARALGHKAVATAD